MNHVELMGRFTADPEIRYTQGEKPMCIANFTIAVPRKHKNAGQPESDFPRITAFGKTAEVIERFFKKGSLIIVEGNIATSNYTDKNGNKVYSTNVLAEKIEFVPKNAGNENSNNTQASPDGFMNIPDDTGNDFLPFA